jgi:hypothetical protein
LTLERWRWRCRWRTGARSLTCKSCSSLTTPTPYFWEAVTLLLRLAFVLIDTVFFARQRTRNVAFVVLVSARKHACRLL